jgi:hypothetical protein
MIDGAKEAGEVDEKDRESGVEVRRRGPFVVRYADRLGDGWKPDDAFGETARLEDARKKASDLLAAGYIVQIIDKVTRNLLT